MLEYGTSQVFLIGGAGALYLQCMLEIFFPASDPIPLVTPCPLYKLLQRYSAVKYTLIKMPCQNKL